MRIKQFEDKIEESPDFLVLRNHIAKTVTGDGKKIYLMNCLWRLLKEVYNSASSDKLVQPEPERETPDETPTETTEALPSL